MIKIIRKTFDKPFSTGGRVYPPGIYEYEENMFARTLIRVDEEVKSVQPKPKPRIKL